jgi:hypothetical protein
MKAYPTFKPEGSRRILGETIATCSTLLGPFWTNFEGLLSPEDPLGGSVVAPKVFNLASALLKNLSYDIDAQNVEMV